MIQLDDTSKKLLGDHLLIAYNKGETEDELGLTVKLAIETLAECERKEAFEEDMKVDCWLDREPRKGVIKPRN